MALAAIIGTIVPAGPSHAAAGHLVGRNGATGCGVNTTDSEAMAWYNGHNSDPDLVWALDWNRGFNVNPTRIDTSVTTTWSSTTDVGSWVGDWSGASSCPGRNWTDDGVSGLIAVAWIQSLNAQNEAEQHRLYFDDDYVRGKPGERLRFMACHETGHTLGLVHTDVTTGGCLTTTHREDIVGLGSHYVDHVNAWDY